VRRIFFRRRVICLASNRRDRGRTHWVSRLPTPIICKQSKRDILSLAPERISASSWLHVESRTSFVRRLDLRANQLAFHFRKLAHIHAPQRGYVDFNAER